MEYNLEIKNLNKKYFDFELKNINIKLPKGKIIGFIGENGSGKTTTIKSILNLIKINKGEIYLFGKSHKEIDESDYENIGVVLDDSFFSYVLNVDDINKIMKNLYKHWDEKLYYQYISNFNIPKNKMLKEFSSGMKMKIKVICAISHHPKLLILDEPTNGLDPVFRYEILELFEDFVKNGENSIFISTHITSDLEHIADEIIFINNGEIMLDIEKRELFKKYGLAECEAKNFIDFENNYYDRFLKYKDNYLLLISDKEKFQKKYKDMEIKKPSLEELMLMFIKGEK